MLCATVIRKVAETYVWIWRSSSHTSAQLENMIFVGNIELDEDESEVMIRQLATRGLKKVKDIVGLFSSLSHATGGDQLELNVRKALQEWISRELQNALCEIL